MPKKRIDPKPRDPNAVKFDVSIQRNAGGIPHVSRWHRIKAADRLDAEARWRRAYPLLAGTKLTTKKARM